MEIRSVIAAGLCMAMVSPFAAKAAVVQPGGGYYRALIYIASATGSGCSTIGYAAGSSTSGIFYYPGPSKTGAVIRFPNATDSQALAQTFPKTPAAGVTSWSGSSQEGYEPSGPYVTIPFSAKVTYLDAQSFSAVFSSTLTVGSASCSISENILFFKTGT